ncbi:hypothetical protein [Reyranella sp.]|uniref:hypothetical protein n=1 Tax=Reyranella sp. TaxID=1929291 RepID=UPI003D134BAF
MSPHVFAPARTKIVVPVLTAIVAVAIFVVDTLTPLDIAVAVLYVAVVLLAIDFAGYTGILAIAAGCAVLTIVSFVLTHDLTPGTGPMLRCFVSLAAIAITALLAGATSWPWRRCASRRISSTSRTTRCSCVTATT